MNRLPIVKVFALRNSMKKSPSKDHIFGRNWPSICRSEQKFCGIAGFLGKDNFAALAKILTKKILTSQTSQASNEMAYFDVKGWGENDKYQDRA